MRMITAARRGDDGGGLPRPLCKQQNEGAVGIGCATGLAIVRA
jgi:hypothetical protein